MFDRNDIDYRRIVIAFGIAAFFIVGSSYLMNFFMKG